MVAATLLVPVFLYVFVDVATVVHVRVGTLGLVALPAAAAAPLVAFRLPSLVAVSSVIVGAATSPLPTGVAAWPVLGAVAPPARVAAIERRFGRPLAALFVPALLTVLEAAAAAIVGPVASVARSAGAPFLPAVRSWLVTGPVILVVLPASVLALLAEL